MSDQTRVIGIAGPARSGKDTVAAMLGRMPQLPSTYHLAGPIKAMAREFFLACGYYLKKLPKEETVPGLGVSPRQVFQTLGTEWGREVIDPDIWVKLAEAHRKGTSSKVVVVPDIRFENEAEWVREHGVLIHVFRPVREAVRDHVSEDGVGATPDDLLLRNDSDLDALEDKVKNLVTLFP